MSSSLDIRLCRVIDFTGPHQFMPERFFDGEGNVVKVFSHFFPFSRGKRVYLGESLARTELFIFLTAILKNLRLSVAENHPAQNPEEFQILITKIPAPFFCKIDERV